MSKLLTESELNRLHIQLNNDWRVEDNHHLSKTWKFPDFAAALAFTNAMGAEAEAQDHHPDIYLAWGKVQVKIFTHTVDGLTENDFILAARIDALDQA